MNETQRKLPNKRFFFRGRQYWDHQLQFTSHRNVFLKINCTVLWNQHSRLLLLVENAGDADRMIIAALHCLCILLMLIKFSVYTQRTKSETTRDVTKIKDRQEGKLVNFHSIGKMKSEKHKMSCSTPQYTCCSKIHNIIMWKWLKL